MAIDKRKWVEVVMPNGYSQKVPEHMLKDLSKFGVVLSTARSIKNPPAELLQMPIPRKVVLPVLEEKPIVIPEPVEGAQYPGDEPVNQDEKVIVKKVTAKRKK